MKLERLLKPLSISLFFVGIVVLAEARPNCDLAVLVDQGENVFIGEEQGSSFPEDTSLVIRFYNPKKKSSQTKDVQKKEGTLLRIRFYDQEEGLRKIMEERGIDDEMLVDELVEEWRAEELGEERRKTKKKRKPRQKTTQKGFSAQDDLLFGLKTDLIMWTGLLPNMSYSNSIIPNLGVELYFRNKFSLSIDGSYSKWKRKEDENKPYQAYMHIAIEPRWWILKDKPVLPYVGIYGIYGQFQVENSKVHESGDGIVGGFAGGGISLGCAFPIYKGLTIDLGVRGGYSYSPYTNYIRKNSSRYQMIGQSKTSQFVLQGVSLSVVYRFGFKKR